MTQQLTRMLGVGGRNGGVILALTLARRWRSAPQLVGMVVLAILVLGILGTGIADVINYILITTEGRPHRCERRHLSGARRLRRPRRDVS